METHAVYAVAGAIALGMLAFLHALVWRAQRQSWSLLFALAFGCAALIYAFDGQARPPGMPAHPLAMLVGAVGLLMGAWALIDYVGLPEPTRTRLRTGTAAVLVAFIAWRLAGGSSRLGGFVVYSAVITLLAGLAGWAMRREPRHGHGFVLVALALFPVAVAGAALGWIEIGSLRYLLIVPTAVLGMTVLTTGLLRAQRRADTELVRRREAESALRSLNESLEQRVAARTGELAAMVTGLESFNRNVSHDLRGPLGGIASAMDLAIEALERGDNALLHRLLPPVRDQARVSAELVASLLELARAGRVELAVQEIAPAPLVADALKSLQGADATASRPPVTVQALPTVVADPGLLRQVFVNLIGNAIKFSGEAAAPQIEVGARHDPDGPVLFVRDNGVGFSSAETPRLFEPFQRPARPALPGIGRGAVDRQAHRRAPWRPRLGGIRTRPRRDLLLHTGTRVALSATAFSARRDSQRSSVSGSAISASLSARCTTAPRSSTTAWCVIGRMWRGFCSTMIADMPSSRTTRAIERSSSSTMMGASPSSGSSSSSSVGFSTSARATASICCSPPESWLPMLALASGQAREHLEGALAPSTARVVPRRSGSPRPSAT